MFDMPWTVSILDATLHDCRWPDDMDNDYSGFWSVTTHYCGRPAIEGKVYCDAHHKLAYSHVPMKKGRSDLKPNA